MGLMLATAWLLCLALAAGAAAEAGPANPWAATTAEKLAQFPGVTFGDPEDAEDIEYRLPREDALALLSDCTGYAGSAGSSPKGAVAAGRFEFHCFKYNTFISRPQQILSTLAGHRRINGVRYIRRPMSVLCCGRAPRASGTPHSLISVSTFPMLS